MYVLGVNPSWHDSSAALLKDGQLVVLVEQDRISRVKHAIGEASVRSIAECLFTAGIILDEVEVVALGWDDPIRVAQNGEQYDPVTISSVSPAA